MPTLVLWGANDQIVDADYGRAYAQVIPGARVELLTETGHSPQLETPAQVLKALNDKASHRPGAAGLSTRATPQACDSERLGAHSERRSIDQGLSKTTVCEADAGLGNNADEAGKRRSLHPVRRRGDCDYVALSLVGGCSGGQTVGWSSPST